MTYTTKSLYLAACLYSYPKVEFVGTQNSDTSNIVFVFKPKKEAEKFIDDYYTGKAVGNLRDTLEGYKTLKDLVFEIKGSQKRQGDSG